mmetsp:Transcript_20695/g.49303  ORF Transcript_20695/g.49303 Transcript_20695/m.49303 type:complete len:307 (+) Transcript_20695:650-1570(+)
MDPLVLAVAALLKLHENVVGLDVPHDHAGGADVHEGPQQLQDGLPGEPLPARLLEEPVADVLRQIDAVARGPDALEHEPELPGPVDDPVEVADAEPSRGALRHARGDRKLVLCRVRLRPVDPLEHDPGGHVKARRGHGRAGDPLGRCPPPIGGAPLRLRDRGDLHAREDRPGRPRVDERDWAVDPRGALQHGAPAEPELPTVATVAVVRLALPAEEVALRDLPHRTQHGGEALSESLTQLQWHRLLLLEGCQHGRGEALPTRLASLCQTNKAGPKCAKRLPVVRPQCSLVSWVDELGKNFVVGKVL